MAKDIKMKDLIKENFGTSAFSTVGGLVTLRPVNTESVPSMSELRSICVRINFDALGERGCEPTGQFLKG